MIQDLRYALRTLFRQPSFVITCILTLALGIGASTAIFSVFNGLILQPLPFERPEQIVAVVNVRVNTGTRHPAVSAPDVHDWRMQSRSFQALAYYTGGETSVGVNGTAEYASAYVVSPGFFEVLGARAAVGRLLTPEEQSRGGPLAAVITDAFWRRHFNGDVRAIGATIKINDRMFTVSGVLAPGIRFPSRADIYYPSWVREETPRSGHNYLAIGRILDGVTIGAARSEMAAIATRLAAQYPQSNEGKLVDLVPLHELIVGDTRGTLQVLLGAVGLVLLIACANVANLLLARSSLRSREMVVRAAVGASRGRLVRQLLTESAVLGIAAGLLGVWLARLGVIALLAVAPPDLPRAAEVSVDQTALGFAMAIAILASFLFGLAPALQVSRVNLVDSLRQGGKGPSTGVRTGWARSAFVIAEVALAVVLVAGASLLGRSLAALSAVDLGFDSRHLLVLKTVVPLRSFSEAPRAAAFYRELLPELRAVPAVDAVSAVTSLPTAVRSNGYYWIEGRPGLEQTGVRGPQALLTVTAPQYFRTLGAPIARGRDFVDSDRFDAPFVAIINESLAEEAFTNEDPLGRRIACGLDSPEYMTIIGIVGDVRTAGPSSPAQPELYMPFEQHPAPAAAFNIVARTRSEDPLAVAEVMRRIISSRSPDVPVRVTTMESTLAASAATPRFRTLLLAVFAVVALVLASAGVYGVMAYTVSQRIPELGVRIALGATPEHIMRLTLGQGSKLALAGLLLGLAFALAAGRVLEGLLFGVTSRDPLTMMVVVGVVALATLFACYIPARRAVRVDPMVALRD